MRIKSSNVHRSRSYYFCSWVWGTSFCIPCAKFTLRVATCRSVKPVRNGSDIVHLFTLSPVFWKSCPCECSSHIYREYFTINGWHACHGSNQILLKERVPTARPGWGSCCQFFVSMVRGDGNGFYCFLGRLFIDNYLLELSRCFFIVLFRPMAYQEDNNGFDRYDGFVVRIRGLPWSASQDEVANFLSGM